MTPTNTTQAIPGTKTLSIINNYTIEYIQRGHTVTLTVMIVHMRAVPPPENSLLVNLNFTFREFSRRFCPKRLIHSDGGVNHARQQPAGEEQLGLSVLLRDTSTLGGVEDQTSNVPVTSQPALPPGQSTFQ